jgi:hypothetical protein
MIVKMYKTLTIDASNCQSEGTKEERVITTTENNQQQSRRRREKRETVTVPRIVPGTVPGTRKKIR